MGRAQEPAPSLQIQPVETGVAALLRSLLPARSADDILAGIVRLHFGDQTVFMPVLPIRANREWKELFNERVMRTLASLDEQADAASVLRWMLGMTDQQLALLHAYDRSGVLPSQDWLDENATESELLTALLGCTAAAFPLVATLIELVRDIGDLETLIRALLLRSTSPSPPSTDGSPARLKAS